MGSDKLQISDCSLKFEVFDFDIMSADDAMGSATGRRELFHHPPQTNAETVEKLVEAVSEDKTLTKSETKSPSHVEKVRGAHGASATTVMRFKDGYFTPKRSDEMMVHLANYKNRKRPTTSTRRRRPCSGSRNSCSIHEILERVSVRPASARGATARRLNKPSPRPSAAAALKIIDTTIEDKKNKLSRLAVADRDMPTIIRNYIRNVLCMYIADIQQELERSQHSHEGFGPCRRPIDPPTARVSSSRARRKHRGVFGFIVDFLNGARCWYLYNEVPGDLSIFGKVRNPYWWIFLATEGVFWVGSPSVRLLRPSRPRR